MDAFSFIRSRKATLRSAVVLLSIVIGLFFLGTGAIQEDAFITYKTARTFALTGIFSYNDSTNLPGSTSVLYGLWCALVYLVSHYFGENSFLTFICIFNSAALGLALSEFILLIYFNIKYLPYLLLLTPAYIRLLHTGMETSLTAALVVCIIAMLSSENIELVRWKSLKILVFMLCALRIDGLLFFVAIFIGFLAYQNLRSVSLKTWPKSLFYGKHILTLVSASCLGTSLNIVLNLFAFRTILPHTAIAKQIAYADIKPSFLINLKNSFLLTIAASSHLAPGFLKVLLYVTPLLVPTGILFLCLQRFGNRWVHPCYFKDSLDGAQNSHARAICMFLSCSIVPALAYSLSGILFPWYLWTGSLCYTLLSLLVLDALMPILKHNSAKSVIYFFCFTTFLISFVVYRIHAIDTGFIERERIKIAFTVRALISSNDLIMLEPAGYIPFYSRAYTIDEIGLTSSEFTDYLRNNRSGSNSIASFWIEKKPKVIIQRSHILQGLDTLGRPLTHLESYWFKRNYRLAKEFKYTYAHYCVRRDLLCQLMCWLAGKAKPNILHGHYYVYVRNA